MFTDYRCPTSAIDCRHRKQASDDFSIVGDYRGIIRNEDCILCRLRELNVDNFTTWGSLPLVRSGDVQ